MIADLLVIVPSRGRPQNIARLDQAVTNTSTGRTSLQVMVDDDDPTAREYPILRGGTTMFGPRLGLGATLNKGAVTTAKRGVPYVGFMGDDHCPRSHGWDTTIIEQLQQLGTGIVYGNDLIQGERLPTAVFMTSDIVRALGYMVPVGMRHLFLDNFWLTLGQALNAITYLPDVVIEHMHPIAGKADTDDGYARVNHPDVWTADEARFNDYLHNELAGDIAKIQQQQAAAV